MSRWEDRRALLREIRSDVRVLVQDLGDLLPLVVRRTTADRWAEQAEQRGFEMGCESERYAAERMREAPAVGAVFRTAREALGLTVTEVAARAGVEADYLERIEQGTEVASPALARELPEILGQWMAEAER